MKKIGQYTARGFIPNATEERILLFDGSFKTAYRVTKFEIVIYDADNSGTDGFGTLSTVSDTTGIWDFTKQSQIGWGSCMSAGSHVGPTSDIFNLIDRDNLIVEDLYVYAEMNAAGAGMNYYIELDKYDISEDQGALALVRNKQQG